MPIAYTPVTVDLRVTVDAGTNVEVLDTAADSHADAVVCSITLNASTLFTDSSNGVFEFWEPSSDRGTLIAKIADGGNDVALSSPLLAEGLQACLVGSLDASAAPIFSGYPVDYQSPSSIGELALGYAAHQLFGHVAATAAIVNDAAIVSYINGTNMTDAKLGEALAAAILMLSNTSATTIANVVIGQDAARARDEDNNEFAPDVHRALRFVAGDKVYVAVNLKDWTNSKQAGGPGAQAYIGESFTAQKFYFLITLA